MPINGFQISKDKSSSIVLGATNSVTITPAEHFNLPAKTFNFIPAVTNPSHIALSPDMKWFAIKGKEKINIYSFPGGKLTNSPAADSDMFNDLWVWYYKDYNILTNTFYNNSTTITVFKTGGMKINRNGTEDFFEINGMGKFRPFHGVGFSDNGNSFLFEYGYELMGLNLETKNMARLTDGIGCILLK